MKISEPQLQSIRGDHISMIFQEPMTSLNPLHTIEKQVGEVLKLHRHMDEASARKRVLELLRKVGIASRRSVSTPIRTSSLAASASAS